MPAIHLHCLVLDGVYRRGADGTPEFVEAPAPTDEALQTSASTSTKLLSSKFFGSTTVE